MKHILDVPIRTLSIVGLVAGLATSASAETVIYHTDFSEASGALNGAGLDTVASGYDTTWSANTIFNANGSFDRSTAQGTAILDFTPTLNQEYRLEVSFRGMTTAAADWDFLAAGFLFENTIYADGAVPFSGDPDGQNWMQINRGTGQVKGWGTKAIGSQAQGSVDFGGAVDVTDMDLRIDMTQTADKTFNIAYYAKDKDDIVWTTIGSVTDYVGKNVAGVGFGIDGDSVGTTGTIESFTLTAIPEPSMLGLVGVVGMVALLRRRSRS